MKNFLSENIKTVLYALIIAVFIRSIFFQPFYIPSSSMEPTLLVGDRLFVTKYSYGYSKHSFPFSPSLFNGRILYNQPKRGDVVVFKINTMSFKRTFHSFYIHNICTDAKNFHLTINNFFKFSNCIL